MYVFIVYMHVMCIYPQEQRAEEATGYPDLSFSALLSERRLMTSPVYLALNLIEVYICIPLLSTKQLEN